MAPVSNKTLMFRKIPTAAIVPGEHIVLEDVGFDPSSPPPPGGVTLSILWASLDPYLRGRMRPAHVRSYVPAFELDTPVTNACVARVLKSDATPAYHDGDLVVGALPLAEYAVLDAEGVKKALQKKVENPHGLKEFGLFLGPLGMPGLTAWSSLYEIGQPKKGETIFISSAAGAVGQLVGQVAKKEGLRVIGSVGSDEKLEFITKELGFEGFNYKKEKPRDALKRLAPDGLDIYYENVGGEHLEAALDAMKDWGRIVACGMISQYNLPDQEKYGVRNLFLVVSKRLTMRGFIVHDPDFGPKYTKDHQEKLSQWLAEGSVKAKLSVTEGIEHVADALVGVFEGKNFGKAVIKIKAE
ncbi:NAD(P)-binding protein [Parathielavia appendiculata]|uniref:Dehydrogenase FUB6 n=1 Tax=Parathielavia appendiculata TaxID=2587402 RepID=A0AAN6YZT1_9PEZI|nr:NAD(P)-binding protein [Parathielavia appendiculata]